jgi:predicted nucleic acid-binding Zn ribbon protein
MDEQGPERISEILSRLFTARGWGRRQERSRLEQAWSEAAGAEMSRQTRVGTFRRGILEIEVGNAVLIQELAQFHKRKLLEQLKRKLTGVMLKDLRFRAGVIN